jgi:hypothetical protein
MSHQVEYSNKKKGIMKKKSRSCESEKYCSLWNNRFEQVEDWTNMRLPRVRKEKQKQTRMS